MVFPEGRAIVYCEGSFNTPNGKTAHGLVRFTNRYEVLSVVDSRYAGQDAGSVLDQKSRNIPVFDSVRAAFDHADASGKRATHLVVGLAPDGGRLSERGRSDIKKALRLGLNVDSGLHDFLSDDPSVLKIAHDKNVQIRDVRKPRSRDELHFFSGRIDEVTSTRIALLGTDSAIGKRTTAWILVHALQQAGHSAEMVGTGQTAWMQGAQYSLIMDSLINDFVAGEIEHAVWQAWHEKKPDVIVIEGQGSLMNPAYPGGYEILAAGRPHMVILQHAPARKEYDGFPGFAIHPLAHQIKAVELISEKPVVAITVNHENLSIDEVAGACLKIRQEVGLPAYDVLLNGAAELVSRLVARMGEAAR